MSCRQLFVLQNVGFYNVSEEYLFNFYVILNTLQPRLIEVWLTGTNTLCVTYTFHYILYEI